MKVLFQLVVLMIFFTACSKDDDNDLPNPNNGIPIVKTESSYTVMLDEDITYADGLSHDGTSTSTVAMPQKLDVYHPNNNSTNRPVYLFIH